MGAQPVKQQIKYEKDQDIEIYMEVEKKQFRPSQRVSGNVNLVVKNTSNYEQLTVSFEAEEFCRWNQGSNETDQRNFQNRSTAYKEEFSLAKFNSGIQPGHYQYPFELKLPDNLPNAICLRDMSLKYNLLACLHSTKGKKFDQLSTKTKVNCYRGQIPFNQAIKSSKVIQSGYCQSGVLETRIESEKSVIKPGDILQVKIIIDNTRGRNVVHNVKLLFATKLVLVAQTNSKMFETKELLKKFDTILVAPGGFKQTSHKITIPEDCGRTYLTGIFASWSELVLSVQEKSLNFTPLQNGIPLMHHPEAPNFGDDSSIRSANLPPDWSPLVSPKTNFGSMKPYKLTPAAEMIQLLKEVDIFKRSLFSQNPETSKIGYTRQKLIRK